MEFFCVTLLNGLSYGLLLFMLSSGLTLIFSMMGILNFAHASFYMLGAYFGYSIGNWVGFVPALVAAPIVVGLIGAAVERYGLRFVHRHGHVAELMFTFGLAYAVVEIVQIVWGRTAVPYRIPDFLQGPAFTIFTTPIPAYRAFMMGVSLFMLAATYAALRYSRLGLVVQAALTHPESVEALGHDVPRVFTLVFGGGSALAGLAGVIGGNAFVTEPAMAGAVGSIIFVIVIVGGLGSLVGALAASLLIGITQTFAVSADVSIASLFAVTPSSADTASLSHTLLNTTVARIAPILPYALLVLMMFFRPRGLMGTREA
ncbi:branched-chain amino acid ABC transporter permease [Variovorax sp. WS11]|uniref:branched-chain amino acid ABC transporter permease n=1 Tax=Variovorax sp. WS11 TaxID=1105204 RepID=UPI000D0DB686|nr:branched-chain amino acid ABC transporter permease [Variovorax sp. WS11]NDZ18923.1 branched-chain amino acid ABC transporter permease [Variovorax sp. WS11]PSL82434.1 branched-chain amino acid ABC transporter permease [Variovorax sp. WS11]